MSSFIKKNGLLYSEDLHTVLGVDDTSTDFTGRIPFGAHRIDDDVFSDCPYESISLPDSVTELGTCVFENSKSLEKVKLSSALTELPPYLFSGCSALTKVTMPTALTSFPEGLFKDCESLPDIPFRAGITVLPVSVFEGCKSIKSLVIPPTVKRIESKAVAGCTSLESVVFPASLEYLAPDAFEGCTALHNIRVDGDIGLFYVGENDGYLYEAADEGDRVVLKTNAGAASSVSFYKDNADEFSAGLSENEDEEFEDDDTFFSAEIGASAEEADFVQGTSETAEPVKSVEPAAEPAPVQTAAVEAAEPEPAKDSAVESMLADIMGAEKERNAISEEVAVSEKETEVLSEAMSVMADSNQGAAEGGVTDSELEKLFAKNEETEFASHNSDNPDVLDSKAQILTDSVGLSAIYEFEPKEAIPDDPELFVIAEKLTKDENGKNNFSSKLIACCQTFARIHDYKRVIMLYGLPLDNDEFVQFFKHFIAKKNVILACEAESPATLSDFGKTICDFARISLKKEELIEQRRTALLKTKTLVKLVIRDKYE